MADNAYLALDRRILELKSEVALAIGEVTLEWNKLQESLAALFARVLNARSGAMALKVWHSQVSDRAQRQMLRDAIGSSPVEIREDVVKAIKWLLDEADKLSNRRNQTVHTHFSLRTNETGDGIIYDPDRGSLSKHAQALAGTDPIPEFRKHAKWAGRLSIYAIELWEFIPEPLSSHSIGALPAKPRRPG